MNALQSPKANGLNQDQSNGVGSGAVPAKKCHRAATTKIASARYWMREQHVLDALADLDPAPAHPRHQRR